MVSALVDRTKKLRTYIDYLDEGGGATAAWEATTWEALEGSVADIDALWRSNPGETLVRRAWYPDDFSFLLRWWIDVDEEPNEGNADLTGDFGLVQRLSTLVSRTTVDLARSWWEARF